MAAPLAFHAAPPPGQWINDPNALLFHEGEYRLFAQHRADAPAFRETGWARFSSPDLLRWRYDGVAIPPDGADWSYSGSVHGAGEGLVAVHTLHADGLERQVRRTSADGGASWSAPEPLPSLGGPARNRRDPFVFRDGGGWALLLAEPCDWTGWREDRASRLKLYRSEDGSAWREAGTIGPWHPPGVMWEVPLLARIGGRDVLFVSTVDRRGDGAACAVRAWVGALREDGFEPDPDAPVEGQPVDLGPDFYALMVGAEEGWPGADRRFVAWAGGWATARQVRWPGFHGGPIALPRSLDLERRATGPWLANRPTPGAVEAFGVASDDVPVAGVATASVPDGAERAELTIAGPSGSLDVRFDLMDGAAEAERRGEDAMRWSGRSRFPPAEAGARSLALFVDGPLVELFLLEDGAAVTAALDGGGRPFRVALKVDGAPAPLRWRTLGA